MHEILIDAPIGTGPGEISVRWVRAQLRRPGEAITLRIHSEGGSVFEALAIYDLLAGHPGHKTGIVESVALSAASVILCACDARLITPNGYVMIHAPYIPGDGPTASEAGLLQSLRDRLISIYATATGKPAPKIARLVDQETFLDADAAVHLGIVQAVHRFGAAPAVPAKVLARMRTAAVMRGRPQPRPAPLRPAKAIWIEAVQARMRAGRSLPDAVRDVARAQPELRRRLISESNP